jgi:hypothetical protein
MKVIDRDIDPPPFGNWKELFKGIVGRVRSSDTSIETVWSSASLR